MLKKTWHLIKPRGGLVLSLRLTEKEGIDNIDKSYQFINFEGKREGETAPYVVLNFSDWMKSTKSFSYVLRIQASGYYGSPSSTATTPFEKVCFPVFLLKNQSATSVIHLLTSIPLNP